MQLNINSIKICAKIKKTPAVTFWMFVVFVCMLKNAYWDESMSVTYVFWSRTRDFTGARSTSKTTSAWVVSTSHTDALLHGSPIPGTYYTNPVRFQAVGYIG